MIIHFDRNKMTLKILVGAKEKYEPSETVSELSDKVESLRAQLSKFMEEVVSPQLDEIQKVVEQENRKYTPE
jgi:hypothetical protein